MAERVVISLEGQDAGGSALLESGARDVRALGQALQESLGTAASNVSAQTQSMGDALQVGIGKGTNAVSRAAAESGALAGELVRVKGAGERAAEGLEHAGGKHISMRLVAHAAREGASGMLMLAGASRGAAGEVAGLLAHGIRGFAHGGALGVGIAAVTGLIHILGKETRHEAEEAAKASEIKVRALEKQAAAYDRLREKVAGLEQEDRAKRQSRPVGEVRDDDEILGNRLAETRSLIQAERELQKVKEDIAKAEARGFLSTLFGGEVLGPLRARKQALESEIAGHDDRLKGTSKDQDKLQDRAEQDKLAAEGKTLGEELANRLRDRIKLAQEERDELLAAIEERKKALVDEIRAKGEARSEERAAMAEEGDALANAAALRIQRLADEKVLEAEEKKIKQHLQDELSLLMATNDEERRRIQLKVQLRGMVEQGLDPAAAGRAQGKFDADEQQRRVIEYEKNLARKMKEESAEAERRRKEREAARPKVAPGHETELRGSFSGGSGTAQDPQARRVREKAIADAAAAADRRESATSSTSGAGGTGGGTRTDSSSGGPWTDVKNSQKKVVLELMRLKEETAKAAKELAQGFDAMTAAIKADGATTVKILRDVLKRVQKLEQAVKQMKEEKDALAAMSGKGAGV